MKILFLGSLLFILFFLIHLVVWRIRVPEKQTKTLIYIFIFTLIIGFLISKIISLFIVSFIITGVDILHVTSMEVLHILVFVISLFMAYLITYSAIEADSPSFLMIMVISRAGGSGLNKKMLLEMMTDEVLVIPRIKDLLRDGLIYLEEEKHKITHKGLLLVQIFIFYRRLLNLGKGG